VDPTLRVGVETTEGIEVMDGIERIYVGYNTLRFLIYP